MKLIIAGGRNKTCLTSFEFVQCSSIIHTHGPVTEIVSGGATGADAIGEKIAVILSLPVRTFEAQWRTHGKMAGPMRNALMARYADAVILFDGGRGTENMFRQAQHNSLQIFDLRSDANPKER